MQYWGPEVKVLIQPVLYKLSIFMHVDSDIIEHDSVLDSMIVSVWTNFPHTLFKRWCNIALEPYSVPRILVAHYTTWISMSWVLFSMTQESRWPVKGFILKYSCFSFFPFWHVTFWRLWLSHWNYQYFFSKEMSTRRYSCSSTICAFTQFMYAPPPSPSSW